MQQNRQKHFIQTPIASILEDLVAATAGIGDGIETYPLCDYVMQSVFLKMTGAQEQKVKCIRWELATNDYDYRYEFTKTPLGECSNYADKEKTYRDLIRQIKKHCDLDVSVIVNRGKILEDTSRIIVETFQQARLAVWAQKNFNEYLHTWKNVTIRNFASDEKNLFSEAKQINISLRKIYENHLYRHRNRIAHNTQSYQQNLPTLKTLIQDDFVYDNYFFFFSILVLIDKIYVDLYSMYLLEQDERIN